MHEIEALVDVFERHGVRNEVVDVDLAVHVPVDDLRHIGAPARTTECSAFPDAYRAELEGTRGKFLPCARNADSDAFAPAAVAAFERLSHRIYIADAFDAVVGAAARQFDEMTDNIALDFLRVHEMRHPELTGKLLARRIDVDADDHVGTGDARALYDIEADAAKAEDDDI